MEPVASREGPSLDLSAIVPGCRYSIGRASHAGSADVMGIALARPTGRPFDALFSEAPRTYPKPIDWPPGGWVQDLAPYLANLLQQLHML